MVQKNKETTIYGNVMKTYDYDQFRILEGNRPVLEQRIRRIRKSIEDNGQLFSLIVTNERMEIMDGQARFTVFRALNLPIYYVVQPGMTLKDCQVLNSTGTPWTMMDYVGSYVVQGNENYIRLNSLIKSHPDCNIDVIRFAVTGSTDHYKWSIKDGTVTVSAEDFVRADKLLKYAERFLPSFKPGSGPKAHLLRAAIFCYGCHGVDGEKLVYKWEKYGSVKSVASPAVSIRDAICVLERAYNFKSVASAAVYFEAEYDKFCREQNASYASRWASRIKRGNTKKEE